MEIITGKIKSAQKVVVYGPEGIGKTTFASHFPDPLFIDTEGSTKHMDVKRTPKPSSFAMLLEQVKQVKQTPGICQTLVIDTADWAEQLCVVEVCTKAQKTGIEDFGFGKGYVYLAENFGKLLNLLEEIIQIGIHVVVTAHAQMRRFDQPDEMGSYDRWELKLQKKTAPLIKEWADMVLFANYKTYVTNVDGQGAEKGKNKASGGKRVMFTNHHPCWDAKNRHGLEPELPFDYEEIAACFDEHDIQAKIPQPLSKKETIYYWYDQAKDAVFTTINDREPANVASIEALTEEMYQHMKVLEDSQKEVPQAESQAVEKITLEDPDFTEIIEAIPKPLLDLMHADNVTSDEIQSVVAEKGYYPNETPIEKYETDFINGVLIGAWAQVCAMIETKRKEK
ncbi:MAG: ATP-binding protein [Eubacterium sp.]